MIDKAKIEQWFIEAVRLDSKYPQALKDAILDPNGKIKHPRFQVFKENLCEQFVAADKLLQKRGNFVKLKTIQDTVYQFAEIFMKSVEVEANRMYETELEKSARAAEAEKLRQIDDFTEGGTDNEYSVELGLISEETKVKEYEGEGKQKDRSLKAP